MFGLIASTTVMSLFIGKCVPCNMPSVEELERQINDRIQILGQSCKIYVIQNHDVQ